MMMNFMSAKEARNKTEQQLNLIVSDEMEKIEKQIEDAVDKGTFSTVWKIPENFSHQYVAWIIQSLFNADFILFDNNEFIRQANQFHGTELEISWKELRAYARNARAAW